MSHLGWYSLLGSSLETMKSLVWPLTVVALALLFRHELRSVMGRVSRLKFRDFEAEFRDELRKADDLVPDEGRDRPHPGVNLELNPGPAEVETPLTPRESVRTSWAGLERIATRGGKPRTDLAPERVAQIERLRALARMVDRHADWTPPWEDADRFRKLTERVRGGIGSA